MTNELIARALLAALESIIGYAENFSVVEHAVLGEDPLYAVYLSRIDSNIEKARAAIAKAK